MSFRARLTLVAAAAVALAVVAASAVVCVRRQGHALRPGRQPAESTRAGDHDGAAADSRRGDTGRAALHRGRAQHPRVRRLHPGRQLRRNRLADVRGDPAAPGRAQGARDGAARRGDVLQRLEGRRDGRSRVHHPRPRLDRAQLRDPGRAASDRRQSHARPRDAPPGPDRARSASGSRSRSASSSRELRSHPCGGSPRPARRSPPRATCRSASTRTAGTS